MHQIQEIIFVNFRLDNDNNRFKNNPTGINDIITYVQ